MSEFIFVFGSNLRGKHGKGSAQEAMWSHGAVYGQGVGRQGDSYAIPTKDKYLQPLTVPEIRIYVDQFLAYAKVHSDLTFKVVKIGTGLAGYTDEEIAPLFRFRTENVKLHNDWIQLLEEMYT